MSPYNLLVERWIPVRRASGTLDWIAPWQIAETHDPAIRIESPRPDFDGALIQFLIGLVQTAAAPARKSEWRKGYERPPEDLREKLATVSYAFNLDGDGPRFMQDLTLKFSDVKGTVPIRALLIDAPAEFFVKPDLVRAISYSMAAVALFTLQTNAPSGGVGHRTSLRGGGPLTTVILGDSLWRTVWLNVLTEADFHACPGDAGRDTLSDRFPWMAPTRTSEAKDGTITTPDDAHPAQHYWAMPRRIRLNFDGSSGCCDLSGETTAIVSDFIMKNYGINYEGAWVHPLTPYTVQKEGEPPNPRKGQLDGIPYRDWPQLTLAGGERLRARVVSAYESDRRFEHQSSPRLWVFGYDVDNMKPRGWYSGSTPILPLTDQDKQREYAGRIQKLIQASEDVRKTLVQQLKAALLRRPQDRKGDLSFVSRQFWADTESSFFESARRSHDAIAADREEVESRELWLTALHGAALRIFNSNSQAAGNFADTDVKRVSQAWNALVRFTSPRSNKLRALVDLPALSRNEERGELNV
jgi:CRISPR system Cascade subunit CasA